MPYRCDRDRSFGQFGFLFSEIPAGGYLQALSIGTRPGLELVVSSWGASMIDGTSLQMVTFPGDGHPAAPDMSDGTWHSTLSPNGGWSEYVDSSPLPQNELLLLVREAPAPPRPPAPWTYILRFVSTVPTQDIPVPSYLLIEPSTAPPTGNVKLQVDPFNANRLALVSSHGGKLRVTIATLGQQLIATPTDFSSVLPPALPNVFVQLRVDSLTWAGNSLFIAMTGWRTSGDSQGLVFRVAISGTTASRDATYGDDGLWQSSLANYKNFRATRYSANVLVGTAGSKLVAFGIKHDGQDLDTSFGSAGICEFDLGGTLNNRVVAAQDRNQWIYVFAQRQDLSTVGARIMVSTPFLPVANGAIDSSFGANGVVALRVDGYPTAPAGIVLTADTIEVGIERSIGSANPIVLPGAAHLKMLDGSRDASFGSAGAARHSGFSVATMDSSGACLGAILREQDNDLFLTWVDDQGQFVKTVVLTLRSETSVVSIHRHSDGSIWLGGGGNPTSIVKLTSSGSLDTTFANAGYLDLRASEGMGFAEVLGFRQNGSASVHIHTIAGEFITVVSSQGAIDTNYGQNGFAQIQRPAPDPYTWHPSLQSDDSLIFSLYDITVDPQRLGLGRIDSTGNRDSNFGSFVEIPTISTRTSDIRIAAIFQNGGKLYAVGTAVVVSYYGGKRTEVIRVLLISRWNLDGKPDYSFNGTATTGGTATHHNDWACTATTIDSNGVVTLAGMAASQPTVWQLDNSTGDLDPDFGNGGVCTMQLQEVTEDAPFAVAVLPGPKIRLVCHTGVVQFTATWFRTWDWPWGRGGNRIVPFIRALVRRFLG